MATHASPSAGLSVATTAVGRFLLDPTDPTVSAATLRTAGLAAYAYCVLPADDRRRESVKPDYLRAIARHHDIRRELVGLLRIWADAGIETLLFKGFHLAEFVYPAPGMRHHGDVDVLVEPHHVPLAVATAVEHGWEETNRGSRFFHNVCALRGPSGTMVDLHRYTVHRWVPWARRQPAITRAMWKNATPVAWEGTSVRLPATVDALLVGLVLQRLWGDYGILKPHDALDARLLKKDLNLDDLYARARHLQCENTLAHFLERCDLDRGRVALVPSRQQARQLARIIRYERGPLGGRNRPIRGIGILFDIIRVLPDLLRARSIVRNTDDLPGLLRAATPSPPRRQGSLRRRFRIVRATRWATRLFRLNPAGDCLLRSVATYTALRKEGWPVVLVSGIRRDGSQIHGHAWLEHRGYVLPELAESQNPMLFAETFRWPADSSTAGESPTERMSPERNAIHQTGQGLGGPHANDSQ